MKNKLYTLLLLIGIPCVSNAQQLKINEVMASNTATISSDLGNFGDWVEIYNPTGSAIDLAGLYFTDDIATPTKYQFPSGSASTIVPANGFKLVWADDSAQLLHANFKLSSSGETIAIFAADGVTLLDSISFGAQTTDVSYGRTIDGGTIWTTFTTATPEASNDPTTLQNDIAAINYSIIHPNPAKNQFYIAQTNWNQLEIIDIKGATVMHIFQTNAYNNTIDISNLNDGIYFIKLQSTDKTLAQKFIKN